MDDKIFKSFLHKFSECRLYLIKYILDKKKILKIQPETLKRPLRGAAETQRLEFLEAGFGAVGKVTRCSPPSPPPNLGARVTSRKFLNGQTAGKSRDRGTGYILEKGSQSIFSENTSDNSCWLKVKLVEEKVNQIKETSLY